MQEEKEQEQQQAQSRHKQQAQAAVQDWVEMKSKGPAPRPLLCARQGRRHSRERRRRKRASGEHWATSCVCHALGTLHMCICISSFQGCVCRACRGRSVALAAYYFMVADKSGEIEVADTQSGGIPQTHFYTSPRIPLCRGE